MSPLRWTCSPYPVAAADRLSAVLGLSPTAAAILVRRGYADPEDARRFLAAADRHDPFLLPGARAACDLVLRHVERGSRIVVHGDYDVDGVCSTAILVRTLRALGAEPAWRLPSRLDGGYGLSRETVSELAGAGADLLVTVDCGITAVAEVEDALGRGIDVVVTDHHRPAERLPPCPTVHPALGGYPFEELCAAGVAEKLSEALYAAAAADPARAEEDLDLVALATVADLVPLRGENRRLVRAGLAVLARARKPGLRALLRGARVDPGEVTEQTAGFVLAPRLNAAGRLGRADAALELLLTEDEVRAEEIAGDLELANRERRDVETRILFAAEAARSEQDDRAAYVLAGEGWHPGVIGVVASRIVERHHRPCVMIALGREGGRGSGRSIGAYDLHAGLTACASHLRHFGGHRLAAGLEIDRAELEGFRRALQAHAGSSLSPADLQPVQSVDAVVSGDGLGLELAEELTRLAPFGAGNPQPTLLVPSARVGEVASMGGDAQHARFVLATGGARARAVAFRTTARSVSAAVVAPHDAAVRLELHHWNGVVTPRLALSALCPTEPGRCELVGEEEPFWTVVERELCADPTAWPFGEVAPGSSAGRQLRDRRGEGLAGVLGALLSSGERVLAVCADVPRRRQALEKVVAGLARSEGPTARSAGRGGSDLGRRAAESGLTGALAESGGAGAPADQSGLSAVSWESLARRPALARSFAHLVAVDPPPVAAGEALIAAAPAESRVGGFAHLAWGTPDVQFALAIARTHLDLREPLASVYRSVRAAGAPCGSELERLLRGDGRYGRDPVVCGRILRVLVELELLELTSRSTAGRGCRLLERGRTALERSSAYRAYAERLAEATRYLSGAGGCVRIAGQRPDLGVRDSATRPDAGGAPHRRPARVAAGGR